MKVLLALIALNAMVVDCAHAAPRSNSKTENRLISALIQVESRGNDYAIGDRKKKEMAYGCLQIRKPCIEDVNKRFGTKYQAKDCLGNRALSVWVCESYISIYATEKHLGRTPTNEDMARIWNGGPGGWKSPSTNQYWSKVRRQLK